MGECNNTIPEPNHQHADSHWYQTCNQQEESYPIVEWTELRWFEKRDWSHIWIVQPRTLPDGKAHLPKMAEKIQRHGSEVKLKILHAVHRFIVYNKNDKRADCSC